MMGERDVMQLACFRSFILTVKNHSVKKQAWYTSTIFSKLYLKEHGINAF